MEEENCGCPGEYSRVPGHRISSLGATLWRATGLRGSCRSMGAVGLRPHSVGSGLDSDRVVHGPVHVGVDAGTASWSQHFYQNCMQSTVVASPELEENGRKRRPPSTPFFWGVLRCQCFDSRHDVYPSLDGNRHSAVGHLVVCGGVYRCVAKGDLDGRHALAVRLGEGLNIRLDTDEGSNVEAGLLYVPVAVIHVEYGRLPAPLACTRSAIA